MNFKKNISYVFVFLLVIAAVALISSLSVNNNGELEKINPKFSIGALDATGEFMESDSSLVTKEAFVCNDLTVYKDFNSDINYQIFFYDYDENFILSTEVRNDKFVNELPNWTYYARIVITPVWDKDIAEEDQIIKWYEVYKYSSKLNVEISSKNILADYTNINLIKPGLTGYMYKGGLYQTVEMSSACNSAIIKINHAYDYLRLEDSISASFSLKFAYPSKSLYTGGYAIDPSSSELNVNVFKIPEGVEYVFVYTLTGSLDGISLYYYLN